MSNKLIFKCKLLIILSAWLNLVDPIFSITTTDPLLTSWVQCIGYGQGNGSMILANIQKIMYSVNYVYVYTSSVPSYYIGPWKSNPNYVIDQKNYFKFPRKPQIAATKYSTPMGHIGLWINGVSIYNADDGNSYNNQGVWNRNAYMYEGVSFDNCTGHPDSSGEYHNHINPNCLYTMSSSSHSPIIGWMFDGYPIYGPYAYSNPESSSSSIKRMVTGYALRTDMAGVRRVLPNGTILSAAYYGPNVDATYVLGAYLQDYKWSSGGDLDIYNGRYCVTPEYPSGTYAYFISIDANGNYVYPFFMGPQYYGTPVISNYATSGSSKSAPSESVTYYFNYTSTTSSALSTLKFNLGVPLFLALLIYIKNIIL